jgi:D-threo-aldose 1-dehydrogenase
MSDPNRSLRLLGGGGGPSVSRLCLGTSSFGRGRDGDDPGAVLDCVLNGVGDTGTSGPVTLVDTSNEYSGGVSETMIGDAIRRRGGLPHGVTIQTKLDRDIRTGDFSAERMRRSIEESLSRLALDSVPMLYLHDPEHIGFAAASAPGGPLDVLVDLKRQGIADAIGVAGGPVGLLRQFVATGVLDAVITHNRYTLVDRSAAALIDDAHARGMSVLNAAVFGGGALARWPAPVERYAYRAAPPELAASVTAMGEACARYGIPLSAAAVQFSTRDPRITSTIFGANSLDKFEETRRWDLLEIPAELWRELETLVPSSTAWQDPPGAVQDNTGSSAGESTV